MRTPGPTRRYWVSASDLCAEVTWSSKGGADRGDLSGQEVAMTDNKFCRFPALHGTGVCGILATHEVTYEGPGNPAPVCPVHRLEAALDATRQVSIRRLRLR